VNETRQHKKYDQLIESCRALPPIATAVAHPCDASSLSAAIDAMRLGLITPILVGNTQFIGNVVYRNVLGLSYNLPFAAAYATVPLFVMGVYLILARRTGAFEAL